MKVVALTICSGIMYDANNFGFGHETKMAPVTGCATAHLLLLICVIMSARIPNGCALALQTWSECCLASENWWRYTGQVQTSVSSCFYLGSILTWILAAVSGAKQGLQQIQEKRLMVWSPGQAKACCSLLGLHRLWPLETCLVPPPHSSPRCAWQCVNAAAWSEFNWWLGPFTALELW